MAVFLKHVNYVEILEINCKYQLKYRIEKYQYRLKSLISYRYRIVSNFPVSPITTARNYNSLNELSTLSSARLESLCARR